MPSLSRITAAVGAGAAGAAIAVGALAATGTLNGSDATPAAAQSPTTTQAAAPSTVTVPATTGGAAPATTGAGIDYEALYAKVSGSVVEVQARGGQEEQSDSPFPDPRNGQGVALGTGFVVDADGTIVTNAHVVGTSDDVSVRFAEDDPLIPAKVLGRDPSSDVAVLRIDPAKAGGKLTALPLADSDQVKVGEPVLAIGNPFGLERTATSGIVSATGREIDAPNGFSISGALQTDAAINSGNSGGPLLDGEGRVIGINSQILAGSSSTGSSGNVGIGFAISSNSVRDVLPQLAAGRTIQRPYLGIATSDAPEGQTGAVVGRVSANGPGAKGGIRAEDVITSVAGKPVTSADDVAAALADHKPGDTIPVVVRRDGKEQTLQVRLGTRPQEAQ